MAEVLMLNKIITCEIKEVAPRVLEFVGSTETKDRTGDIVKVDGWQLDKYLENPLFMWAHDYTQPPIGKAVKVWTRGKKLMFHIEFADKDTYEFADTIYKLYKGGYLRATSVGFTPLDWEGKQGEDDIPKWAGNIFTSQELLELSGCPVPSNPEALATAKQKRIISAKEYKAMSELWQALMKEPEPPELKEEPQIEPVVEIIPEITKPEVTDNYIRIPVKAEEGKHDGHRIRTITISEEKGIKALYCGEDKVVITYLFDKDKWNMDDAQAWVEEHSKDQKALSQIEIMDELDYCLSLIKTGNLNDDNRKLAVALSDEIRRLTGGDIPVEIKPAVESIETLTEQDKETVAHLIYQTIDRVINKVQKNRRTICH